MYIVSHLGFLFFPQIDQNFLYAGLPGHFMSLSLSCWSVAILNSSIFLPIDPIFKNTCSHGRILNSPESHHHWRPSVFLLFHQLSITFYRRGFLDRPRPHMLHVTKFVVLVVGHLEFFPFLADWLHFLAGCNQLYDCSLLAGWLAGRLSHTFDPIPDVRSTWYLDGYMAIGKSSVRALISRFSDQVQGHRGQNSVVFFYQISPFPDDNSSL